MSGLSGDGTTSHVPAVLETSYGYHQIGNIDQSGDTIMGGINLESVSNGELRRAKWKSKVQLEK